MGGYDDGLGNSQALLVTESGGKWQQAVQAQAPAGAAVDPFKVSDGGGLAGSPVRPPAIAVPWGATPTPTELTMVCSSARHMAAGCAD